MTISRIRKAAVAALVFGAMSGLAGVASAEPSVMGLLNKTCTAINCGSVPVLGRVGAYGEGNNSNAWVGQFLAAPGNCIRFDVTSANQDLEMIVIRPSGTFYRNDDNIGTLNPRVIIASGEVLKGVYTVVVQHFSAGTEVSAAFTMRTAQYNSANPNCSSPTTPQAVSSKSANIARTPSPSSGESGGPSAGN